MWRQSRLITKQRPFLSFMVGGICASMLWSTVQMAKDNMNIKDNARINKPISSSDIQDSVVYTHIPQYYVARPAVEKILTNFIEHDGTDDMLHDRYMILYGARGCGKSTVVEKCLEDRKGVARVHVSSRMSQKKILQELGHEIKAIRTNQRVDVEIGEIYDALKGAKVYAKGNNEKLIFPTIVFEVEQRVIEDFDMVGLVGRLADYFAKVANVIIVLAEVNSISEFGREPWREIYLYLGDMSKDEVRELLQKTRHHLTDEEVTYLYDNLGGNPIEVMHWPLSSQDGSLHDYVQKCYQSALHELVVFQLQPLLSLLKKHPDGVGYYRYPISLTHFGYIDSRNNAVYYDMNSNEFKLQSPILKDALKDYTPREPRLCM